jgi:hypothetical protein
MLKAMVERSHGSCTYMAPKSDRLPAPDCSYFEAIELTVVDHQIATVGSIFSYQESSYSQDQINLLPGAPKRHLQ